MSFFQRLQQLLVRSPNHSRRAQNLSKRWQFHLGLEELRPRCLPSASPVSLAAGQLVIHGTNDDDTVSVAVDSADPTRITVDYNSQSFEFRAAGLRCIVFAGGSGNDSFSNTTTIRAVVNGG